MALLTGTAIATGRVTTGIAITAEAIMVAATTVVATTTAIEPDRTSLLASNAKNRPARAVFCCRVSICHRRFRCSECVAFCRGRRRAQRKAYGPLLRDDGHAADHCVEAAVNVQNFRRHAGREIRQQECCR